MNVDLTLVFLGLLVFSAHLFASIYNRKKIPDVLLLILIGLLVGPVFGWANVDSLGMGGPVFVAVTLVVILFEGGTSLSLKVMRASWKSTMNLTVSCFFLSAVVVTLIGLIFGMTLLSALLLGSILGGTSSAVVIPLVRILDMGEESRTVLVLESAATDVLCIVFTLAFISADKAGGMHLGTVIGNVLSSFVLAGLLGFAGALVWSRIISQMRKLQNSIFTTPAFVFIVYGVAQLLGYSGAIAALVFGITMANIDTFKNKIVLQIMGGQGHQLNKTEMVFFGELVFLLKTFFFVYIGISIQFSDISSVLAGLVITIALFFGRVLVARYFSPKTASPFDKNVISLMIPKGLAAAVLAGMPLAAGVPCGEFIKNVTYMVVLFSIVFVSFSILLSDKFPDVRAFFNRLLTRKCDVVNEDQEKDSSERKDKDDSDKNDEDVSEDTPYSYLCHKG